MKKQQSSFHMNNEFNGFGEIRYLKGTQQEYYPTVSQENIHPSLDVGNYLLKVIGSVPVVIHPAGISMCLRKLAGALASVNQVIVSENENHNGYQCNFVLAKPYDITDGSYSCFIPKEYNTLESVPGIPDHWIAGGEPEGKIWQYYQNGKLLKSTWISENGKKYYIDRYGYMVTGWKIIEGKQYYFKSRIINGRETAGHMAIGWLEINGRWFYFKDNGRMTTSQFIQWKGNLYYLKADGEMAVNEVIEDFNTGKRYQAEEDGVVNEIIVDEKPCVNIPQDGKLGTVISYMGWHLVVSKTSDQYKLKEDSKSSGRYSIAMPEYYAMVDGRIVIATKQNIGGILKLLIGDYVDVEFKKDNGSIVMYPCIIGDFKGNDAPNIWGHYNGMGVVEIIYHNYSPSSEYNQNKNNPWGSGRVIKITKVGNYYDE